MTFRLVVANKLYSSWSMRPWLVMRALDIPFVDQVIPLKRPETRDAILKVSPSGKLPALVTEGQVIWDSLAIIEYLAEKFPDKGVWPKEAKARAHARAISNEMHGGFLPLRQALPMNLGKRFKTPRLSEDAEDNVARIEEIWRDASAKYGQRGKFLFGNFSAADAMYAPVVTRLDTYQIPVTPAARTYMDTVLAHPAYLAWKKAALAEAWTIPEYEAGHEAVANYR